MRRWVTQHDDEQRFPAGFYVLNAKECTGLSKWTVEVGEAVCVGWQGDRARALALAQSGALCVVVSAQDKALVGGGQDPVLWYSFGTTHIVRVEDFPIMPVRAAAYGVEGWSSAWLGSQTAIR